MCASGGYRTAARELAQPIKLLGLQAGPGSAARPDWNLARGGSATTSARNWASILRRAASRIDDLNRYADRLQ
jgi:hypothetical protein